MIRFLLQRLLLLVIRIGLALLVVGAVIEVSRFIFGKEADPIWAVSWNDPVPGEIAPWVKSWEELLHRRISNSGIALLLALTGALAFGYSWGILVARLRALRLRPVLSFSFQLFASIPGFWFVVLVALYSYVNWQRPGFANDVVVETGPDLLRWWNALVVAIPAAAAATAWQFRAVSDAVDSERSRPFVSGLFMAGFRDDEVFYHHVLRQAKPVLCGLIDGSVPLLLGTMVFAEAAFRYEGMGALLVESLHEPSRFGLLASSLWMITVASILLTIREVLEYVANAD
ncbi:MAG: ABC transporter permease subunit [Verrucomicrobiota bacterium]